MAETITTRTYAVPFNPFALAEAAELVQRVADRNRTAMIVSVKSAYSEVTPFPLDEYHVRVRGVDKVHSDMLGRYQWVGPDHKRVVQPTAAMDIGTVFLVKSTYHLVTHREIRAAVTGGDICVSVQTVIWREDRKEWNPQEWAVVWRGAKLDEIYEVIDHASVKRMFADSEPAILTGTGLIRTD